MTARARTRFPSWLRIFRIRPRYSVKHRARAKVPFVSEQVEKFILGHTTRGAEDELEYLSKYLG